MFSFNFSRDQTETPLQKLFLLRNQTKTLATQARSRGKLLQTKDNTESLVITHVVLIRGSSRGDERYLKIFKCSLAHARSIFAIARMLAFFSVLLEIFQILRWVKINVILHGT